MQRLERFKWIPMLLRAWEEARERTEAERKRKTGKEDSEETGLESPPPAKPSRPPGKAVTTSTKSTVPAARRVTRPVKRPTRPAMARKQGVQTRIRKSDYQAVLQELREAKKQLGQLDSIRHQLDELQAWFEARMAAAEKSPTKTANRPMPLYGVPAIPGQMAGQNSQAMNHLAPPSGAQTASQQQPAADRIGQEPARHTEAQKEGSD